MLTLAVLVIGLLTHVSLTLAEHRLGREQAVRSEGLHVARQFTERLRSDEDWAGLYDRLRQRQILASTPTPGSPTLDDGREAFVPQVYFPDFSLSAPLSTAHVLVDVPFGADPIDPGNPPVLREDLARPEYGLPADLNGDGLVEAASRNADYSVLPVCITVRWVPPGEGPRQFELHTWLRGDR